MIDIDKLGSLVGSRARTWSYTCTHDTLVVEIGGGPVLGGGYLIFSLCSSLSFPVFWTLEKPTIKAQGGSVLFSDVGVSISCRDVMWRDTKLN